MIQTENLHRWKIVCLLNLQLDRGSGLHYCKGEFSGCDCMQLLQHISWTWVRYAWRGKSKGPCLRTLETIVVLPVTGLIGETLAGRQSEEIKAMVELEK